MAHLLRFFLVTRVLLRYFIVRLKMFLGMCCCTVDHRLRVFWPSMSKDGRYSKPLRFEIMTYASFVILLYDI